MVELVREGGVARIFLNRPQKVNALDSALLDALASTVDSLSADPALRVVVLAGRGSGAGALGLWIRRWFTRAFFQDDIARLGGIRYNPRSLTLEDRDLIDYFDWAASLPSGPAGDREADKEAVL